MGLEGRTISRVREKSSLSALPTPWSLVLLWKRILCYQDRPENFVPSGLEITYSQWYRAALCTVKNGSSHLTCIERSEPLDGRGTSSNWLRSESIKGTDPHIFLSQASVRITAINKYQHNTKFCIFITCLLPTQTSTLRYPLRWPAVTWTSSSLCVEQCWVWQSRRDQGHISLTWCGCNSSEALLSKMTDSLHSLTEHEEDHLSSTICVHLTWQSPTTTEYFPVSPGPLLAFLLQCVCA